MTKLSKDVSEVLEKAFNEKIENFEIEIHEGNKKGEGFFGEIMFLTLKPKKNGEHLNVVIKKVLTAQDEDTIELMSAPFHNEIYFYEKILPELNSFQAKFPEIQPLDFAPKLFTTCTERGKEKVVLENIKFKNYELHPKTVPLSSKMYENIFSTYGKFHAISFALKELEPNNFSKLVKPLRNNWKLFANIPMFEKTFENSFENIKKALEAQNEEKSLKRFDKYKNQITNIFKKSLDYDGSHSVIVHGDCWSNNMMFKYNLKRELEDIKLLDFQICYVGTPVWDLSYTFYSGAAKESLDNLDKFLKIYHLTLTKSLKQFGLDANKIYSFENLKEEWRKYCRFGFVIGLLIWGTKTVDENDAPDVIEILESKNKADIIDFKVNRNLYDEQVCNLVRHMCENDFI